MDDQVLEAPAVFYVHLSSEDGDLVVTEELATVVIKDGDGKLEQTLCCIVV